MRASCSTKELSSRFKSSRRSEAAAKAAGLKGRLLFVGSVGKKKKCMPTWILHQRGSNTPHTYFRHTSVYQHHLPPKSALKKAQQAEQEVGRRLTQWTASVRSEIQMSWSPSVLLYYHVRACVCLCERDEERYFFEHKEEVVISWVLHYFNPTAWKTPRKYCYTVWRKKK